MVNENLAGAPPVSAPPQETVEAPPAAEHSPSHDAAIAEARAAWEASPEHRAMREKAKAHDQLIEAQKSELQKLQEKADAAEQRAAQMEQQHREMRLQQAFARAATAHGVPADRLDAAYKIADMTGVTLTADGDITGIAAAVKSLPDWLAARAVPDINGRGRTDAQPDPVAREAELKRMYRLG